MKRGRNDGTSISDTAARAWESMREASYQRWEHKGMCDDVYYVMVHKPCGTEVMFLEGALLGPCPKCHPKEWAKARANDKVGEPPPPTRTR